MSSLIYPHTRPDFYFRQLNQNEYNQQLSQLTSKSKFHLGFSENRGFVHFSIVGKVIEVVKGLLGFTDRTHSCRLNAEWLKFLYYGEARGFLYGNRRFNELKERINHPSTSIHPAVFKLFKKIEAQHRDPSPRRLARMREIVSLYHTDQAVSLQPSFWSRLLYKPSLDNQHLIHYGDTSLAFAQKALSQSQKDIKGALNYFLEAYYLHNEDPDFQRKLVSQFKNFLTTHSQEPAITSQKELIHRTWIGLAKSAFRNNNANEAYGYLNDVLQSQPSDTTKQEIALLYLAQKEFSHLEPLLSFLQALESKSPAIQAQIGDAHWHYRRYAEGINAKLAAIQLYLDQTINSLPGLQRQAHQQVASLYSQLGQAYTDELEGISQNPRTAAAYFEKAVSFQPNEKLYQRQLNTAYIKIWNTNAQDFFNLYESKWLPFLKKANPEVLQEEAAALKNIILTGCRQLFCSNRDQYARQLLAQGIKLFSHQDDFILQILELSLECRDLTIVDKYLQDWQHLHCSNPFIQAKIGDIYWDRDKQQALNIYHETAETLAKKLQNNGLQESERQIHQICLAHLKSRIGQNQLETPRGFFQTRSYDEALAHLEESVSLHSTSHIPTLFDAYLKAAAAENQRVFPDWDKIMSYYSKAFTLSPQNGAYLTELMQLYLYYAAYHKKAAELFAAIAKTTWKDEFKLQPEEFDSLAQILWNEDQKDSALYCYNQAHKLKPDDKNIKTHFYEAVLAFYLDKQRILAEEEDSEEKIQKLLKITEALKENFQIGFSRVEALEGSYRKALSEVYRLLAKIYERKFYLDRSQEFYIPSQVAEHQKKFAEDIKQAIFYYDQAILYSPKDPSSYFDKGMILDFKIEFDEALQTFRKAVEFNKENAFYRKQLAVTYGVLGQGEKKEKHEKKIKKLDLQTYLLWSKEYFCKSKTQIINPHQPA